MYVIFPAEEVVYLTYGTHPPLPVRPRPTLDRLPNPPFSLRAESITPAATEHHKTPDIFDYNHGARPPAKHQEHSKLKEKAKKKFLRLGKNQDPEFGKTLRSPLVYNYEQPAPLETPAFSKKNIFDRDFDALFEVAHRPEFTDTVRIVTPEPVRHSREQDEYAEQLRLEMEDEDLGRGDESEQLRVPPLPSHPPRAPPPIAKSSSLEEPSNNRRRAGFFSRIRHRSAEPSSRANSRSKMASTESVLRDLTHPSLNDHLKNHNAVSFKLVKTVSDFTSQLSQMYEQQAGELQMLVATYRKRNGELRKERPSCPSSLFHTWETLLQEVEADSQAHSDVAGALSRHVSRPLVERTFHRKMQSRKLFAHREGCETIIAKTEEKLAKSRLEYKAAHQSYCQNPTQVALASYMDSHNAYVQQLHATNGMVDEYNQETLPQLLQELEEIYVDLCNTLAEAVLQGTEAISSRAGEQARRYDALGAQCRALNGTADLAHVARSLPAPQHGTRTLTRKPFAPPQNPGAHDDGEGDMIGQDGNPPSLKDELVLERLGPMQIKSNYDSLRKEALDLELQIKQLQESLDNMARMQQRSFESQLFNKVNELQEDISMKKFDLRVAQIHLSAVKAQMQQLQLLLSLEKQNCDLLNQGRNERAERTRKPLKRNSSLPERSTRAVVVNNVQQRTSDPNPYSSKSPQEYNNKELFTAKADPGNVDRKLSSSSSGSMKTKWLKAFKSLKPAQTQQPVQPMDKKNGNAKEILRSGGDMESHNFLEYTYKKITPCDVCSQVLRGHTRQGLRCRLCKMNVHADCMGGTGKCQTKQRLLRRQKSTSEIEARGIEPNLDDEKSPEVDTTYQVLKHANEISRPGAELKNELRNPDVRANAAPTRSPASLAVQVPQIASSSGLHMRRDIGMRRRLFAGMKSLSMFGSRSRHCSPQHRSISLPESMGMKNSSSALILRQSESASPIAAPHSPRRQKLNLRMKSLSLDSPESTEQRRRPVARLEQPYVMGRLHCGNADNQNMLHGIRPNYARRYRTLSKSLSTPSSPVHNRRLLTARNMRMSSVELPDDHEKSLSSASTSPCPSPVKKVSDLLHFIDAKSHPQKHHRLLPTNLYVVLYNFQSRHPDELDLKAGYKVTVIDTSDPDWWKGKCFGRIGFFPSNYCTRLQAGERPLQVTHNLQVSSQDGENGLMLLRDQIVIQVGEEVDGMVMIRSGDNRQGICPLKFLQEV